MVVIYGAQLRPKSWPEQANLCYNKGMDLKRIKRIAEAEALHKIEANPLTAEDSEFVENSMDAGDSDQEFTKKAMAYADAQRNDPLAAE